MNLGQLQDVPDQDRQRIEALASLKRWERGQALYRIGDTADRVFIIQSGVAAVQVPAPGGELMILTLLGEDSVFGELALVGARRRSAEVVAFEPLVTASLGIDALLALCSRSPAIDEAVMGVMADTVKRLTDQLVEARYHTQPVRLRKLLLRLHRLYDCDRIRLTQTQLAQLIGAQRTTVSELLNSDAASGLIRHGRGWVEVVDAAALRAAIQPGAPVV